jgi:hypothetical protein
MSNFQDYAMGQANQHPEPQDVNFNKEEFKDINPKVGKSNRNKSKPE